MIDENKLIEELNKMGQEVERHLKSAEKEKNVLFAFSIENQLAMLRNVINRVKKQPKINSKDVMFGNSEFAKDIRIAMQDLIDSQPTAYDVDKVVKQLEIRRSLLKTARITKSAKTAADTAYSLAIEDIKKGGINENNSR